MSKDKPKQLHFNLGIPLEPSKDFEITKSEDADLGERKEVMQNNAETVNNAPVVQPTVDTCIMPTTLQSAAQSSMSLRLVQQRLAEIITNENYLGLIAGTNPEVLPTLLDSVNNSVAVSDNLMIQMAKVAEKNASMNRVFEYLTKQQNKKDLSSKSEEVIEDENYRESIKKIKEAIYDRYEKERNEHPKTAKDFIEAEYTVEEQEETQEDIIKRVVESYNNEDDNEDDDSLIIDIDEEEFPIE